MPLNLKLSKYSGLCGIIYSLSVLSSLRLISESNRLILSFFFFTIISPEKQFGTTTLFNSLKSYLRAQSFSQPNPLISFSRSLMFFPFCLRTRFALSRCLAATAMLSFDL